MAILSITVFDASIFLAWVTVVPSVLLRVYVAPTSSLPPLCEDVHPILLEVRAKDALLVRRHSRLHPPSLGGPSPPRTGFFLLFHTI